MVNITLDGQKIEVKGDLTILQVCRDQGFEIPTFCYHPKLSVSGNCRMCLVEVEGTSKPVISCQTLVRDGMVIHTTSLKVRQSRESVLELLLINHPLDCPQCDQGGRCDLQDLSYAYGRAGGRFDFEKRTVSSKDMGPFIATVMNRCIHCSLCIRFCKEIAGIPDLGCTLRGELSEIVSYLDQGIQSELSGNLIDICPVGALNDKPYAFKARPWELTSTPSIDVMDALCSPIIIDHKEGEIMRIRPNSSVGDTMWIHDKTRFSYDGLRFQRLDKAYKRVGDRLVPIPLEEALSIAIDRLKQTPPDRLMTLSGDLCDRESLGVLKRILNHLGCVLHESRFDGSNIPLSKESQYLFNTPLQAIGLIDACLIIGSNLRIESPLVNACLFQRFQRAQIPIALWGKEANLGYPILSLGEDLKKGFLIFKHPFYTQTLLNVKRPLVIVGASSFRHPIHSAIEQMRFDLPSCVNILHHSASYVGGLQEGFVSPMPPSNFIKKIQDGDFDTLYLLGVDHLKIQKKQSNFIIYQGHHGDMGVMQADLVLPGCAFTEKEASYTNTFGVVQKTTKIFDPPGEAHSDKEILLSIEQEILKVPSKPVIKGVSLFEQEVPSGEVFPLHSFYQSNVICRHSSLMREAALRQV